MTAAVPPTTKPAPPIPRSKSLWPRRIVIVVLLVLAVAILVVTSRGADTDGQAGDADPVIVSQSPPPGGRALRQTEVGAMLQQGYDGRLTINGIAIPEGQMEGAVDPSTLTPEELKRFGIRPNNRNSVFFQPGPGKVLESLPSGEVQVVLRYFRDRRNQDSGRTVSWTFDVD